MWSYNGIFWLPRKISSPHFCPPPPSVFANKHTHRKLFELFELSQQQHKVNYKVLIIALLSPKLPVKVWLAGLAVVFIYHNETEYKNKGTLERTLRRHHRTLRHRKIN